MPPNVVDSRSYLKFWKQITTGGNEQIADNTLLIAEAT